MITSYAPRLRFDRECIFWNLSSDIIPRLMNTSSIIETFVNLERRPADFIRNLYNSSLYQQWTSPANIMREKVYAFDERLTPHLISVILES